MRSHRSAVRGAVALAVLAVLTSACGGGTAAPPDGSLAAVGVIDVTAERREVQQDAFVVAEDGDPLFEGDDVRTDEEGFAEVRYSDGSLTRLAPGTEFTIVDLAGTSTLPEVRVRLDVGETWNRVRKVTGSEGRFEVETAVGVAAVRGTGFVVRCLVRDQCEVIVFEGEVDFILPDGTVVSIGAGEQVTFGTEGEVARETLTEAELADEQWIGRNVPRDEASGRFVPSNELCSVTVNGHNVMYSLTPDTAVVVDDDDVVRIEAASTGALESYAIELDFGPFSIPAASGEIQPNADGSRDRFVGEASIADYAWLGGGLYHVIGTAEGEFRCVLAPYVQVGDRNPLTTVAGGLGALMLLAGAGGMYAASRRARS